MNRLRVAFAPYWQSIQHALFPQLERVLGPLTAKQQQLVQTLEVIRIEQTERCTRLRVRTQCATYRQRTLAASMTRYATSFINRPTRLCPMSRHPITRSLPGSMQYLAPIRLKCLQPTTICSRSRHSSGIAYHISTDSPEHEGHSLIPVPWKKTDCRPGGCVCGSFMGRSIGIRTNTSKSFEEPHRKPIGSALSTRRISSTRRVGVCRTWP